MIVPVGNAFAAFAPSAFGIFPREGGAVQLLVVKRGSGKRFFR